MEAALNILVVEDDPETARFIMSGLKRFGHDVALAGDGESGLDLAFEGSFDVAVVDRMLPGLDGLALVAALRGQGRRIPVLLLSMLDGIDDRIIGLEAGGDDYLVKPFDLRELAARVVALARRAHMATTEIWVGDLRLDLLSRQASRAGRELALLPREFSILELLARNAGGMVTRSMLLEEIWNFRFDPQTTVVETHVSRLRAKLDGDGQTSLLQTVRGQGYCLRAPA
jgi:two-component system OmpR family response regulator